MAKIVLDTLELLATDGEKAHFRHQAGVALSLLAAGLIAKAQISHDPGYDALGRAMFAIAKEADLPVLVRTSEPSLNVERSHTQDDE